MSEKSILTHTAYACKRDGKRHVRYLEIGTARLDSDGVMHGFLDRLPIGGFTGYVYFAPIETQPPLPEPARPAQPSDEEDF